MSTYLFEPRRVDVELDIHTRHLLQPLHHAREYTRRIVTEPPAYLKQARPFLGGFAQRVNEYAEVVQRRSVISYGEHSTNLMSIATWKDTRADLRVLSTK